MTERELINKLEATTLHDNAPVVMIMEQRYSHVYKVIEDEMETRKRGKLTFSEPAIVLDGEQ